MPITNERLAMDSAREVDRFGKMFVRDNRISKATINDYYGEEIPGHEKLGLQKKRLYRLLRAPEELEQSTASFRGIPVLLGHPENNNTRPLAELAVGAVMNDVRYEHPYLVASIVVWDAGAQAGIEADIQRELSPSYKYTADMTPGEFEGENYDGVMRDIHAYHLAIVPDGRTGPDILVNDAKPEGLPMSEEKDTSAQDDVLAGLKERLPNASDEQLQSVSEFMAERAAKANDEEQDKKADDEEDKNEKVDDQEDDKKANDARPLTANDAAIIARQATEQGRKAAWTDFMALRQAERDCASLIGEVACDSAEDVYRLALAQEGIDTQGVHPSALPKMVEVLKSRPSQPPTVAMDAHSVNRVDSFFGGQ